MWIRIKDVPPGEAPLWVRQAWVGHVLPLADGEKGKAAAIGSGVLSRNVNLQHGYIVEGLVAVAILGDTSPEAAAWWWENTPHLLVPGKRFLFAAQVCEELPDPPASP
jgi:hypothetical protein